MPVLPPAQSFFRAVRVPRAQLRSFVMESALTEAKVDSLPVPGGYLRYEVRGFGPALLFIPGANGSARPFEDVASTLAHRFRCITYDRRGFARSSQDPSPDPARRLETDSDDARRLIELAGEGAAHVLGSSSGAVVALDLVSRHPSVIRRVVAHEPPYTALVADGAEWQKVFDGVYDEYRKAGVPAALVKFFAAMGLTGGTAAASPVVPTAEVLRERERSTIHWLEHEIRQYTRVTPDIGRLVSLADRVVLAIGADSKGNFLSNRTSRSERAWGVRSLSFPAATWVT